MTIRSIIHLPAEPIINCCYTGEHFGANYPDACCIDGYLWDLDSCDEPGGALRRGGEIPCPECNSEEYKTYYEN